MRFLMIMEDGLPFKADGFTDSDIEGVKAGILEIIDTKTMKSLYDDKWHDLEEWIIDES